MKRKGIGYMIEAIVAMITVLIFVIGNAPSAPNQDWSGFQRQIVSNDLSYALKKTGDTTDLMRRHETGSYRTLVSTLTDDRLDVSGTIENLPKRSGRIGFHVTSQGVHDTSLVDAGSVCGGDLNEINNKPGTTIKRAQHKKFGTYLYVANTGADVGNGYDTLYVDNGTQCQFSSAEGPYYLDEIFRWGNSTDPNNYGYYDFKSVVNNNNSLRYYNATVMMRIKNVVGSKINSVDVNQKYDTFRLSQDDISVYDMIVFKGDSALGDIDASADTRKKVEDYMSQHPVLLMMNLTSNDFDNSQFLQDTGLKWVGMSEDSPPQGAYFPDNTLASKVKTIFDGMDGDISNVNLKPGGHVSSSIGETLTGNNPALLANKGYYRIQDWNSSNWNMNPVKPSTVPGHPDTACINNENRASSNLTKGTFAFPSGKSYDVINTEMGGNLNYCDNRDVRSLSIDRDNDGDYSESNEGPYLNGENLVIDNRSYRVKIYPPTGGRDPGQVAEFIFNGDTQYELMNYRTSFNNFDGSRLARVAYMDYGEDDRKAIASMMYWLLGDTTEFGVEKNSQVTTEMLGSVDNYTYMPYRLSLRWRNR
ncbi:MAG: hypothetical protein ABEJ99_03710 [Candidatus Nanohaloarchaea archaeon]